VLDVSIADGDGRVMDALALCIADTLDLELADRVREEMGHLTSILS
jgi:hypothetical protein